MASIRSPTQGSLFFSPVSYSSLVAIFSPECDSTSLINISAYLDTLHLICQSLSWIKLIDSSVENPFQLFFKSMAERFENW